MIWSLWVHSLAESPPPPVPNSTIYVGRARARGISVSLPPSGFRCKHSKPKSVIECSALVSLLVILLIQCLYKMSFTHDLKPGSGLTFMYELPALSEPISTHKIMIVYLRVLHLSLTTRVVSVYNDTVSRNTSMY